MVPPLSAVDVAAASSLSKRASCAMRWAAASVICLRWDLLYGGGRMSSRFFVAGSDGLYGNFDLWGEEIAVFKCVFDCVWVSYTPISKLQMQMTQLN